MANESISALALKAVVRSGIFNGDLPSLLSVRGVSRSLKGVVDGQGYFQHAVFEQALIKGVTPEIPSALTLERFPSFYKAVLKKDKDKIKKFAKAFFELMLDNLVEVPEIVCRLVRISHEIGLTPEDFNELGTAAVEVFRFLTQENRDLSGENKRKILGYVSELGKNGYSEKQCLDLKLCINMTFRYLLHDIARYSPSVYKNISGLNFRGMEVIWEKFTGANLVGADFTGGDLTKVMFRGANLAGANFDGTNLRGTLFDRVNLVGANLLGGDPDKIDFRKTGFIQVELFDENTVEDFIHGVEKSIRSNSAGILRLLLAVTEAQLDKIKFPEHVRQLKNLTKRCLLNILVEITSVEELDQLFHRLTEINIYSYFPRSRRDCEETYSEVLLLVANTYLIKSLTCDDGKVEQKFKEKLTGAISLQKFYSVHSEKEILGKLQKRLEEAAPKCEVSSSLPRMMQS